MKKNLLKVIALVAFVVVLASCAKVPQVEIDAAKAAIETSKAAGSDRYVPEVFNAANDSLTAALAETETQNSKFVLFRNYDHVSALVASATENANKAATETVAKKAQIKAEVEASLVAVAAVIAEDKELLKKAPKGKDAKAALEAISQEIAVVETTAAEVTASLAAGEDVLNLRDKIAPAQAKATAIKAELEEAIAKKGKK